MTKHRSSRRAITMLEIVIASTIMAVVVSSVTLLLRTSRQVWSVHERDHYRLQSIENLMLHVVRRARQAESVVAVSGAGDSSGSVSLQMPSGETWTWDHDGSAKEVNFSVPLATNLLADKIESFEVVGYEADGTTVTTNVADMQVLKITATVNLLRSVNGTKTLESWVWVRAW